MNTVPHVAVAALLALVPSLSAASAEAPIQGVAGRPRVVSLSSASVAVPVKKAFNTATISVTGVSANRWVKVTIRGPRSYRKTVTLKGAIKKIALPRLRGGSYTVTTADLKTASAVLYPSKAVSAFTVSAKRASPVVKIVYRPAVLTFAGVGNVRLGMTFAQAVKANPSVKSTSPRPCEHASSPYGDLVFNPDGKLAFITASSSVPTMDGLRDNDSFAKAQKIYGFTRFILESESWDYIRVAADFRARGGREATALPMLGIWFTPGVQVDDSHVDDRASSVYSRFLNAGQQCFS